MDSLLYAALLSAVVAFLCAPKLIPILRKMKFGQSIREEGPESHYVKAGTPTMGGLIILLGLTISTLFFAKFSIEIILALFITLGHALLGFIDDFIKVVLKRSLGLKAKEKLLGQIFMAVALSYISINYLQLGTDIWIPFLDHKLELGYFYYPLLFFVLVGTTNAVNLTDGLDGLAAGTASIALITYMIICLYLNQLDLAIFCSAVLGATLAFLKFNYYPAKVFMGDTGSLALGGALAIVAILTKTIILLAILGLVFVMEALSVIIQVTSYKTRGKRVFRMSPLHHHFELGGWNETKVVTVFWSAGLICSLVALIILFNSPAGGL